MISLFTIPRSFNGRTGIHQRNAIGSWLRAIPGVEVILLGDDPGVDAVAAELGVRHAPNIQRNAYGTPLLDSAFRIAKQMAVHDLIGYINTDIVLTSDFARAVRDVPIERSLVIGRRTDLDLDDPIVFDEQWERRLIERARARGQLMHPYGSDYFVFRKETGLAELPAFAVGRPGWDNWFIARARQSGVPVIDITPVCVAVHQNHGYGHVAAARGETYNGPEGDQNVGLARGVYGSVLDATYRLTRSGLKRNTKARWVWLRLWYAADKRIRRLRAALSSQTRTTVSS